MNLSLTIRLSDTYGETVFPKVEEKLESTDYQQALEMLPRNSKIDYRHRIDMLVCELLPKWQKPCQDYYKGKGPSLKDVATSFFIQRVEQYLLQALDMLLEAWKKELSLKWVDLRDHLDRETDERITFYQKMSSRHPDLDYNSICWKNLRRDKSGAYELPF